MGDNDAAMRDIAVALVQLSALQGGNKQNHIPPVTGVGDSVTVVATGAQVPNCTFMAETMYPSAARLQSCYRSAAVCTIQTSAEVDQVERNAVAIEELKQGQAELEENWSFQQQVDKESQEFRSYMENRFDHLEALIVNQHHYEPDGPGESEQY